MNTPNKSIEETLAKLPRLPGVYKFLDSRGKIIYIGKAKSLKYRVSSYFQSPEKHNAKTRILVNKINAIDYVIVNDEREALLLENSLIKENKPQYNILLKDDKTYPWICITKEEYPRIFFTRRVDLKKAFYFGPFTTKGTIQNIIRALHESFPFRTCKLNLTAKSIADKRFSSCLEYHIGNCKGPCIGKQSKENYTQHVDIITSILKGNTSSYVRQLNEALEQLENKFEYEKAEQLYSLIKNIKAYQAKNSIVNPRLGNLDSLVLYSKEGKQALNYMQIRDGSITLSINQEIKNPLANTDEELIESLSYTLKEKYYSKENTLITNITIESNILSYSKVETPERGEKMAIIKLGIINLKKYLQLKTTPKNPITNQTLEELKKILNLTQYPMRIECIDNSNTLGTYPMSSCVVFINGKPSKKDYRSYNVKTVVGPNDYDTMHEIITRIFTKREPKDYPNLLILDGGKGQLHVGIETLKELGMYGAFDLIALAERFEEVYVPRETLPIQINKRSNTLRLLQQIRDEAHRFAITHHTKKRDKDVKNTELQNIKGIGDKTIKLLLTTYGSTESIKNATTEMLAQTIGHAKAKLIREYYDKK